jgi:hypothetical protein
MGSNPIHCVTVVVVSCSMADTTFKGEEATLRAILRVIELGGQPSRPVMEGGRYDLVLDLAGTLWKVQVKYAGQAKSGAIKIVTSSTACRGKRGKKYEDYEVDFILAYSPVTDKIYKLPPEVWRGKNYVYLRYKPAKNNQKSGCFNAEDFEW